MNPLLAGGTIFVSAFFLFQLQPIVAKAILPWFGGSAAVWGTCLMFFQTVLFLGYLYAHWLTKRVSPRMQPWIHSALLAVAAILPVLPPERWKPTGSEEPSFYILLLLSATIGLPYFVLSSTSPLVQAWFSRCGGNVPYRYFALSNAASLVALLGYPIVVEPAFSLPQQCALWSAGFVIYALMCAAVAWTAARPAGQKPPTRRVAAETPSIGTRLLWMLLAGFASVLSLAVTNHLSQNVAPLPLLWVLPLAVYLISFIVTFESERWYKHGWGLSAHAAALAGLSYLLVIQTPESDIRWTIPALLAGLFVCCTFCHGELARRKPSEGYLTQFYLMIALGGALGSILLGLVAPLMLVGTYDLPVALAACALCTLLMEYKKSWIADVALTAVAVGAFVAAGLQVRTYKAPARVAMRSFYGGLRVVDQDGRRSLVHGVVSHGMQFLDPNRAASATMYYAPGTGVQRAIEALRHPGQRVGVIGLGAGTLAVYGQPGDEYRFYEINPQVVDLARTEFSFLRDSRADVRTVIGDGRLSLERESQQFDVLAIDAFSGDAVPVHLLSREAMQLYFRHVQPAGIVAFHVSNSALALANVVRSVAEDGGYVYRRIAIEGDVEAGRSPSDWVLVTRDASTFDHAAFEGISSPFAEIAGIRPWTDSYSTLVPILK